jgi:large subunit ribosomal protein L21
MKAIIETGGKQYYVAEGDIIFVEKLEANENDKVVFDKVLMANGVSGNPYVEGATVTARIVKHDKQAKVVVFRYHSKHNVRKKTGHRQPYTLVEIEAINA